MFPCGTVIAWHGMVYFRDHEGIWNYINFIGEIQVATYMPIPGYPGITVIKEGWPA